MSRDTAGEVLAKTNLLGKEHYFLRVFFARGLYNVMRERMEHSGRQALDDDTMSDALDSAFNSMYDRGPVSDLFHMSLIFVPILFCLIFAISIDT